MLAGHELATVAIDRVRLTVAAGVDLNEAIRCAVWSVFAPSTDPRQVTCRTDRGPRASTCGRS
jgi:hypothetical protein